MVRAEDGEVAQPPTAFEELRDRLRHGTRPGRVEAARELIQGGEEGFSVLETGLAGEAWGWGTNNVTTVIASLGSEAVPLGLKLVQLEGYFDLRHHPGRLLLGRMGVFALPEFSKLLKHAEAERRFDTVQGVRMATFELVPPGARFLLAQATEDADPRIRSGALEALGGCELYSALSRRVAASWPGGSADFAGKVPLEKSADFLRDYVAAGRFEPEPQWPDLREAATTASAEDRATVARTLAMLGTNAAPGLDVIEKLLRDADLEVALEAARVLATVGTPGLPAIERAKADPDPEVRRLAVQCEAVATFLRQVQPVDTLAIVERGLRDSSAEVVYGALDAASFMSFSFDGALRVRLQQAVEAVGGTMSDHVRKKRDEVLKTFAEPWPSPDPGSSKPEPL